MQTAQGWLRLCNLTWVGWVWEAGLLGLVESERCFCFLGRLWRRQRVRLEVLGCVGPRVVMAGVS